jgi:group I intron endonuclease
MAYVYCTHNKVNGKKYIGSSRKNKIDPKYYGSGKLIKQAIKKYGVNNFYRVILWEGKGDAREIEEYWLEYFDCANNDLFYNMTNDARGNNLHKKVTKKEIQQKIKESWKNKTPEEIKSMGEKVRQQKTGKPNPKKGKSDGPKPGVSQSHKGRKSPNEGKGKPIIQYDKQGNFIKNWPNAVKAGQGLGICDRSIDNCLRGKSKSSAGYIWKYLSSE